MDENFAKELEKIDWLGRCGQPFSLQLTFPTTFVSSWSEAAQHYSDQAWEDATLEAQNRLTERLSAHHRVAYQNWNNVVQSAKERIVFPLTSRVWFPLAERLGLGKPLVDCISWDVLGAVMEHEYRDLADCPPFFQELLQVYRTGHFPCGWVGDWPSGKLVVW